VRRAKRPVRKGYSPLIHILATNKKGYNHNPKFPQIIAALTVRLYVHALSPYSLLSTPSVRKSPLTPVLIIVTQKRE